MSVVAVGLVLLAVLLWPVRTPRQDLTDGTGVVASEDPGVVAGDLLVDVRSRLRRLVGRSGVDRDVVALLDALAAGLGAGLTPVAALRAARSGDGALDALVAPVMRAAERGAPLAPAWERVARRTGQPDLAALARAWSLSERLGCPLSEAVRSAAGSSRAATRLRQRVQSATAGARATGTLLTLLPLAGVGLAPLLGLRVADLYGTVVGGGSLAAGVLLLLVGRWSVERLVARVVESA